MSAVEELRAGIPEPAKDIKLNLQSVLQPGALSPAQRWGVAIASAVATRNTRLRDALIRDARLEVGPEVIDDAFAAAALMAMNNVYYRFRHLVGKESYSQICAPSHAAHRETPDE
jgi:lipoyl-dependent peroxiredoxin subunit D